MSTATDPRYEFLGGQTSIFDMQSKSTVLSVLRSVTDYDRNTEDIKKN